MTYGCCSGRGEILRALGFSPSGGASVAPTSSQTAAAPTKASATTKAAAAAAPPAESLVSESDFFDSLGGGEEPTPIADDNTSPADDTFGAEPAVAPPSVGAVGAAAAAVTGMSSALHLSRPIF